MTVAASLKVAGYLLAQIKGISQEEAKKMLQTDPFIHTDVLSLANVAVTAAKQELAQVSGTVEGICIYNNTDRLRMTDMTDEQLKEIGWSVARKGSKVLYWYPSQ